MIRDVIIKEKERLNKILSGDDHILLRDKWFDIKRILDYIYKQIPPISKGEVVIDLNNHPFDYGIFESLLKDLLEEGITTFRNVNNISVYSSDPIRSYYSGENFVIKDVDRFENYRSEVSSFYNYIREDGLNRFYSYYFSESSNQRIEVAENKNINNSNDIKYGEVKEFIKSLSPREQKILEMRYGLVDGVSHTLEEVGQEFEKTRKEIESIELGALSKVKKSISGPGWDVFYRTILNGSQKIKDDIFDDSKKTVLNNQGSKKNKGEDRELSNSGDIKRVGKNANPTIGSVELSKEILAILHEMRYSDGAMFGIFGKWGRGKSFLINEIKKRVKEEKRNDKFVIVDFNAWKYQDTPASWAYLYGELLEKYLGPDNYCKKDKNKVEQRCNIIIEFFVTLYFRFLRFCRHFWLDIRRYGRIKLLLTITFSVAIITFSFYYYLNFDNNFVELISFSSSFISLLPLFKAFSFKRITDQIVEDITKKPGFFEVLGLQHKIQKELEILLKAWFGKRGRSLLLIIDDIDRCKEERIIHVMDSLKIMLDNVNIQKKVVAIAAVDERILMSVVKNKYKNLFENKIDVKNLAKEYLDKLFLCGLRLGNLTPNEISTILNNICKVEETVLNDDNEIANKHGDGDYNIISKDANNRKANTAKPPLDRDKMTILERESIKASITSLGYTPRQIDILVFRYLLARNLLNVFKSPKYDFEDLGMWIVDYTNDRKLPNKKEDIFKKIIEMVVPY